MSQGKKCDEIISHLKKSLREINELTVAEIKAIEACAYGKSADCKDCESDETLIINAKQSEWENWADSRVVRAEIIRFLCTDEKAISLVDPRGIHIRHAIIKSGFNKSEVEVERGDLDLDLDATTIPFNIYLFCCVIPNGIQLRDATTKMVALPGCHVSEVRLDRINTKGAVWLGVDGKDQGHVFFCPGGVSINSANIDGELRLSGGIYGSKERNITRPAVEVCGSVVKDSLDITKSTIIGGLSLQNTRVSIFRDDKTAYQYLSIVECSYQGLNIDGFMYETIESNIDIKWRLDTWLESSKQLNKHQPYEQLSKTLTKIGHEDEAKHVSIEKQKAMVPNRIERSPYVIRPLLNIAWHLYGLLVGYGYLPSRIIYFLILIWLSTSYIYSLAADNGHFAPRSAVVFLNNELSNCRPNWVKCKNEKMAEYSVFNPIIYSLDILIPIIDFKQESDWAPMNKKINIKKGTLINLTLPDYTIWLIIWIEIIFGWVGSVFLVAIVSGFVKTK